MKTWLKYTVIFLLSLIVLLAIAVMAIVNFINPNDYRANISAAASSALHQPVRIEGDLNWQFLPSLGVVVHGLTVGQAHSDLYAQIDNAKIGVHLLPLFHKKIAIKEVTIDGLRVEKTVDGTQPAANTMEVAAAPIMVSSDAWRYVNRLALEQLTIHQAVLTLHHSLTATDSQLTKGEITIKHLSADTPSHFHVSFSYQADTHKASPIDFDGQGVIKLNPQQQQITCQTCQWQLIDTLNNNQKLTLNATTTTIDYHADQLTIADWHGSINGLAYSGQIQASHLNQNPEVTFSFSAQTQQLRAWLDSLGLRMATQDPTVLQNLNLRAQGSWRNQNLTLPELSIALDNSHWQGGLQASTATLGAINTQMNIDHLDIGAYLPPASQGKRLFVQNLTSQLKILLPNNGQSLALTGPITFERLTAQGLDIEHFSTQVDMKEQHLQLNQSKAQLLEGSYQGNSQIDFSTDTLKWLTTFNFKHVQIQPLVQLMANALQLSGQGDVNGSLSSQDKDTQSTLQNLNGNLKVAVHHGVLHGINVQHWLNTAAAVTHQQTPPPTPKDNSTDFGDLSATLAIHNGLISNQDLLLAAPMARVKGKGFIDLPNQRLNYALSIDQLQASQAISRKTGIDHIPLTVTGSFNAPQIQIDMAQLTQQIMHQQLENQRGRLAEAVAQRTGNQQLGHAVGGLIKRIQLNKLLATS